MKSIVHLLVIFTLFLSQPRSSEASPMYSGSIIGTFENPVLLMGSIINVDRTKSALDNTGTAVFTGVGTNTLTWGTNIAGSSPHVSSSLVFTGMPFTKVSKDTQFDLGKLSFLNGTSQNDSIIFGITLNLRFSGDSSVVDPAVARISIMSTINGNVDKFLDADFLEVVCLPACPSLANLNAYEGMEVESTLRGAIIGDPQLTLQAITLAPDDPNGFLVTPEPGSIILSGLGLIGVAVVRRFRAAQR